MITVNAWNIWQFLKMELSFFAWSTFHYSVQETIKAVKRYYVWFWSTVPMKRASSYLFFKFYLNKVIVASVNRKNYFIWSFLGQNEKLWPISNHITWKPHMNLEERFCADKQWHSAIECKNVLKPDDIKYKKNPFCSMNLFLLDQL